MMPWRDTICFNLSQCNVTWFGDLHNMSKPSQARLTRLIVFLAASLSFALPTSLQAGEKFPSGGKVESGDCINGFGRIVWGKGEEKTGGLKEGSYYEGYFKNKLPNGYGKLYWSATGVFYFGEFKDGKEHGMGTVRWPDGQGYTGEYRDGEPAGAGFTVSANGDWRVHRDGDENGLILNAKGGLEREDIYSVTPTKDAKAAGGILIPADLDACFKELIAMLAPELVEKMRAGTEDDMIQHHFGLGLWMRNNWGLWGGSHLAKWFNARGIEHPDDMSGIILDSFWRYLNKKPVQLDEQIQGYKEFWEKQKADEQEDAPTRDVSDTKAQDAK